jgi:anti-sigma factor RsiW
MIDRDAPVTPDELHAYVDEELPADRLAAVEAWLAAYPEDAAHVAGWRAQAAAIRARYADIAVEPTPEHLLMERLPPTAQPWRALWRNSSWRQIAAVTATAAVIGGAAGWLAHGVSASEPSAFDAFTSEALTAHKLYVAEVRHPIEVKAAEDHLMPWLSRRVGTTLRTPNLESFSLKLLGGRLLPGPVGPAALFMYEGPSGERYTMYCSRSQTPRTSLRYNASGEAAAVHWVEGDTGYVMSGPADRDRLIEIAKTAYEQMENRAPTRATENLAPSPAPSAVAGQTISRRGS